MSTRTEMDRIRLYTDKCHILLNSSAELTEEEATFLQDAQEEMIIFVGVPQDVADKIDELYEREREMADLPEEIDIARDGDDIEIKG